MEMAVLAGDPSKPGNYTIRLKLADGSHVAAHWHPEDENVTVLQGTFLAGMGDKYDPAALHEYPAGSYIFSPN
jgi:quercetin dioxygenase-like cupin family protein